MPRTPSKQRWKEAAARIPIRRVILLAVLLWVAFCIFHNPGSFAPDGALKDFVGLEGKIRVNLDIEEGRTFTIADGRLINGGHAANSQATEASRYFGGLENHLPPEGRLFDGPYLESPDGKYLAASVILPDEVAYGDKKRYAFVVLGLESGGYSLNTELSEWKVAGIAWSPDSRRIAVLRRMVTIGFCPQDIFFRLAGHSTLYSTLMVQLVDPNVGVIGAAQLAEDIVARGGRISWDK